MLNDFHGVPEGGGQLAPGPNVRFKTYTNPHNNETRVGVFSSTKRKIPKGQELLTDYGRRYNLQAG